MHLFIEPEQLHKELSSQVVVVDCRFALSDPALGKQQYEAAHIPGAQYVNLDTDLSSPVGAHGGRHPLPSLEAFQALLQKLGVRPDSRLVLYDDSRFAFASRLWWMLRYVGIDRVQLLNGGFSTWRKAGLPCSAGVEAAPTKSALQLSANPEQLVDREAVLAIVSGSGNAVLIDARERARYLGEQEPIDPVAGHIPGALCFPWQELTTPDGKVVDAAANQARWSTLDPNAEVVVYCGSGVTACVDILALHAAGRTDVKLYSGSWSDWCSYADLPVATGTPD